MSESVAVCAKKTVLINCSRKSFTNLLHLFRFITREYSYFIFIYSTDNDRKKNLETRYYNPVFSIGINIHLHIKLCHSFCKNKDLQIKNCGKKTKNHSRSRDI